MHFQVLFLCSWSGALLLYLILCLPRAGVLGTEHSTAPANQFFTLNFQPMDTGPGSPSMLAAKARGR